MVSRALGIATGVTADGGREVLGLEVGDSEDCAFWTAFLHSLKARGLAGMQLVVSGAHTGLTQAIAAVMAGAAWQRCRSSRRLRTSRKEARGPVVVNATVDPSELRLERPTVRCGSGIPIRATRSRRIR